MVQKNQRAWPAATTSQALLRGKMPELDSLRGVAILAVLFYHGFACRYGTARLEGWPRFVVGLTASGWAGVNLFFALSGFLITGILLDSKRRPDFYRRFYWRRALRILPAYYALLLLLPLFGRYALLGESASWRFVGLSAVYLANLTVLFGVPMQFGVLWSLAVEEHFYLLWPMIVRNFGRRPVAVIAVLIAVSATVARVLTVGFGHDGFAHYTWLVADGLALGSLLAVLMRGPLGTRRGVGWMAALAVAGSVALVLVDRPFHHALFGGVLHLTALNLLCTAAVALTLLLGTSSWLFLVDRKLLMFFGEISYGLYLIHMVVFNSLDRVQLELFPRTPTFEGHFGIMVIRFLAGGVIAVGLALLSRRYFEERFLRLKDGFVLSPMGVASGELESSPQSGAVQDARTA
jgi:peptidoglycan/LPS O-acetylase OafA/YrhL